VREQWAAIYIQYIFFVAKRRGSSLKPKFGFNTLTVYVMFM